MDFLSPHRHPAPTYCINLLSRPDRLAKVTAEFHKVGLPLTHLHLHQPLKDPQGGKRGVYLSHQAIAAQALASHHPYITIFEDDVVFLPHRMTNQRRAELDHFLHTCQHWDILYLGHTSIQVTPTALKGIVRCHSLTSHAYLLSSQGMKKLVAREYENTAIDVLYHDEFLCYALEQDIAHQPPDQRSDIDLHPLPFTPDTRWLREAVMNVGLWVQRLVGIEEVVSGER